MQYQYHNRWRLKIAGVILTSDERQRGGNMDGRDLPGMASRRASRRIGRMYTVGWKHGGNEYVGYVCNISATGFCLRTRHLQSPGFSAGFTISGAAHDVKVKAQVVWSREIQVESEVGCWHEMGLTVDNDPGRDYLALVSEVVVPVESEKRRHPRFHHTVRVLVHSTAGVFQSHSFDVSRTGLFILGDRFPAEGEKVKLEMHLPGNAEPVVVRAQVARMVGIDREPRPTGFGVELLDMSEGEKIIFLNYLGIVKELNDYSC